jgi:hypothetical protein
MDLDNPICLYCQGECDVWQNASGFPPIVGDCYTCQKCEEKFTIFFIDSSEVKFISFLFTCKEFEVAYPYSANKFGICRKDFKEDKHIWIPYFDVDFSNKEELYQKIKTYILFS